MNDKPTPAQIDAFNDRETKIVLEFGHAVRYVFGDTNGPAFAYTVGRAALGRADLLVAGNLPPEASTAILNQLARQIDDGEVVLDADAVRSDEVLAGPGGPAPCWLIRIPDLEKAGMFGSLGYGGTPVAWQLVWPDDRMLFPWEPDFDPKFAQPIHGEIPTS